LSGFIIVVLMLAGIHIALFAKYKSGNYVTVTRQESTDFGKTKTFEHVSIVNIRDVNAGVIAYGDSTTIETGSSNLVFDQRGDTLFISGSARDVRAPLDPPRFILPTTVVLSIQNSRITFEESTKPIKITTAPANP
jgi:hypothetical protein